MEVEAWVKEKKELYTHVSRFLESGSDSENEFRALTIIIDNQNIVKNERSIKEIFQLLYNIGNNHHRNSELFSRLLQILQYLTKERLPINDTEIIDIFKSNKLLLLLLFEHKIITINESNVRYLIENDKSNQKQMKYYFFSEIQDFLGEKARENFKNKITEEFNVNIETFETKIKEGENDSPICQMIRQDSIQEFVFYVNQTNLSLTSKIKADFYESNSFLIEQEASLIEYAFFHGSIQVIKYLINNHVEIPHQSWLYAIHSNNPEIIEILESNKIKIGKEVVIESIKCHHNDITNYIMDNLINKSQKDEIYDAISHSAIEFCNYYYLPEDIMFILTNPKKSKFKMCNLASSFTNITIPSSIAEIGDYAFSGCSSLTQITIPSSVIKIGKYSFSGCSSLTQITIPSSVTSIGEYAFSGCSSIKQITIPSSVTSIGEYAFSGCSSLKQITIPSSETGNPSLDEFPSFAELSFSYSGKTIGKGAFYGCSSLTQISIPSFVKSIEDYSFYECSSLSQISIPSSVTYIGNNAFYGCSKLSQITIPSSVTYIGDYAFYGCSKLKQISIPSSITVIRKYSFSGCSILKQISIPSSVTEIREAAFYGCSSLTEISILSSGTEIGIYAFQDCLKLAKISIPYAKSIGCKSFAGCSSLTEISIPYKINISNLGIKSNVKINRI